MSSCGSSSAMRDTPGAASLALRSVFDPGNWPPGPTGHSTGHSTGHHGHYGHGSQAGQTIATMHAAVLAVFPTAVYLAPAVPASPSATPPGVLALVTHDGVRLPNSVVLPVLASAGPFARIRAGHPATLGDGRLRVGIGLDALCVGVRRWWSPAVPRRPYADAEFARRLGALDGALPDEPEPLVHALSAAMAEDDTAGVRRTVAALVGRGPGLTPSGDDVLAGFLVTLRTVGALSGALANDIVADAADRTTALSATLLRHAARGEAVPELRDLLDAVRGYGEVSPAARALVRIGHTSGSSLAHGVLAAGRAVLARPRLTERAW